MVLPVMATHLDVELQFTFFEQNLFWLFPERATLLDVELRTW